MSQYTNAHCILCGKLQLMAQYVPVICNECGNTSKPADEIVKLRKQVAELREILRNIVNQLPDSEIELAREVWGNTNTAIIKNIVSYAKTTLEATEPKSK